MCWSVTVKENNIASCMKVGAHPPAPTSKPLLYNSLNKGHIGSCIGIRHKSCAAKSSNLKVMPRDAGMELETLQSFQYNIEREY